MGYVQADGSHSQKYRLRPATQIDHRHQRARDRSRSCDDPRGTPSSLPNHRGRASVLHDPRRSLLKVLQLNPCVGDVVQGGCYTVNRSVLRVPA